MKSYKKSKISIIGAARSGEAAAYLAVKCGAIPFVSDKSPYESISEVVDRLKLAGIEVEAGENSEKVYNCDLMIVSPGVPMEAPVLVEAQKRGIGMISEVEFAFSLCKGRIFLII
ncbi:MAG: hypothetical protein IPJ75_01770 [Ignavibacteriales bacterium]|nr:hypothetical protein [Ignavibacteriales bacterium]